MMTVGCRRFAEQLLRLPRKLGVFVVIRVH
jgi:hypothetical protein